ncbi:GNAT family N-acetyltransferase [Streptomyces sp. N2-109]|uniref:GNAT family N-acetyltransferase n=1 Tax=Streptomyces gossypii TaxID=2883101 RepID=A0ABT2K2W9_9ACTN|nr:GNAT family N-acetyltransferase [Streptomyces gossypii]MCT2593974.1 GNAT family N-acetyltransferase [Streptomyces gossypii]
MTDFPAYSQHSQGGRPSWRPRVPFALRPRWTRRRGYPPPTGTGAAPPELLAQPELPSRGGPLSLWRMRTTVRDEPGALAALCTALAGRGVDILTLQTFPLGPRHGEERPAEVPSPHGWTVDELLLRAPEELTSGDLAGLVAAAGCTDTWLGRAVPHELVDETAQALELAGRTAQDSAELPLALRQLLGRCTIRSASAPVPPEAVFEEHTLRFPDPAGGALLIERHEPPFTPTEFARARALVALDERLGRRMPRQQDALALPRGQQITVRRADTRDLDAARAMHERCSDDTLSRRYHGPVGDADTYLGHLLSPRFGRTLAAETAAGRLVALGHLLWDGDETEVALLVEDGWQRHGVGGELLRRLAAMAAEAGCAHVYAVTQASNAGMVALMRGLELPLDHQIEEGTLVITAELAPERETARPA